MESIRTLYGTVRGLTFHPPSSNGRTDGWIVSKKNTLDTPYGELVPQYETSDMGRRVRKAVSFYKNGAIKSLPLQQQTEIRTPAGTIAAELVTFHENGAIKRVFPLDGKLSGFWSWKNELALATETVLRTPGGIVRAKILGVRFYECGAMKSVTLWPGESASVRTPCGELEFRTGISFYENGAVRSLEPLKKTAVPTPLGMMTAFDNEPLGVHGDRNSLEFDRHGLVTGLKTVDDEVTAVFPGGGLQAFRPGEKNNVCGDERKVSVPLAIRFAEGSVSFNDSAPFRIERFSFLLERHDPATVMPTRACG